MTDWVVGQRAIVNDEPCTRKECAAIGKPCWSVDTGGIICDPDATSVYPLLTLDKATAEKLMAEFEERHGWPQGGPLGPIRRSNFAAAIESLLPAPVLPPRCQVSELRTWDYRVVALLAGALIADGHTKGGHA